MSIELRPEVRLFAEAMEFKLRKNDGKGKSGWHGESYSYLQRRVEDEVKELKEICNAADLMKKVSLVDIPSSMKMDIDKAVKSELIDVANFIMMIWDNKFSNQ